jgi:YHS domain-containing protein
MDMRRSIRVYPTVLLLATVIAGAGHATDKGKPGAKTAALKCPKCGMTLSTKKTAEMPAMVKLNGKTYYCCKACGMDKNVAAPKKAK